MSDDSPIVRQGEVLDEVHARIDALVEEVAVRDQFLAMVSHELRSPVQSLLLHLEATLLLSPQQADPARFLQARVEKALVRTRQLTELLDRFLDVSRIQAGRVDLVIDDLDLVGLTRTVLARQSEELTWAGCPVTLLAPAAVTGRWDAARLEAVIGNLLSNARKYGAGQPVVVRIDDEPTLTRLAVEDGGPGIAAEDQRRIFERFERAPTPGGPRVSGIGLGLWIARHFIEAHGGTISVTNRAGGGAAFTVILPR